MNANPIKATATLDTKGFTAGVKQVQQGSKSLNKFFADNKNAIDGVAHSLQALSISYNALKGIANRISPAIKSLDELKNATGRLKLVTEDTKELVKAQQELFKISNNSRVSFTQSVDLYARLGRSLKDLSPSQDKMLQVTEAINKSLIVSGASATSAEAALTQLGQGLAAGALRGEELNSVMEQTPRLAEAIAKGMNVGLAGLRKLASEGKVTSEVVFNAILSQKEALAQEFAQMPLTVSQSNPCPDFYA